MERKPAILILHGWGSSSQSWVRVKEILEKEGVSVFVPDLPGFGQEPPPPEPWGVDDYVNWIDRFCERQQLNNFFLLGHSFGGRIAIKFAVKYPQKLICLILLSAAGVTPRPRAKLLVVSLLSKVAKTILSLPFLSLFEALVRKTTYSILGTKDYYFLSSETMRQTFQRTITEDLSGQLVQIEVPTRIVWGENDRTTPLDDAKKMNREIKNSLLITFPEYGHNFYLKAPEKLSEEILKIINRNG